MSPLRTAWSNGRHPADPSLTNDPDGSYGALLCPTARQGLVEEPFLTAFDNISTSVSSRPEGTTTATMALRHITKISDLSRSEITSILTLALDMKKTPSDYFYALHRKTLLMLFEKPSLRTRVSLEAGMTQLGGHGIAYMTGDSPIGKKESYEDTGAVLSRMSDAVTARVNSRQQIAGLAANSTIPIVNALDDYAHPMQMLADLQVRRGPTDLA